MRSIAVVVTTTLALAPVVSAQTARPFPMDPTGEPAPAGIELAYRPDLAAGLAEASATTLVGLQLADGTPLDLALERVHIARPGDQVWIDGVPVPGVRLDQDVTLWAGEVAGDPGSDVFIGFSEHGVRGWIDGSAGLYHLLALPDAAGRWQTGSTLLASERELFDIGMRPDFDCGMDDVAAELDIPVPQLDGNGGWQGVQQPLPLLECTVTIETDTQLYDWFGDVDAEQAYIATLIGAVSMRYREQVGVVLTVPYLALYTDTDPWETQEMDGVNMIDLFYEFLFAWGGGNAPEPASLFHFISGADLGGGVAALSATCHPDIAFGVSANISGITPFPIEVSPLNWDFMVVAHEMGHNHGTSHTHNYCPPLDECAPDGFWGQCQDEVLCTSEGTIMSYCHACEGGLENITTYFHPTVVGVMREFLEEFSCLPRFDGVFVTDMENGVAGSAGVPQLDAWMGSPTQIVASIDGVRSGLQSALVASPVLLNAPFKGGTLVPALTATSPFVTPPSGSVDLVLGFSRDLAYESGTDIWMQAWFQDSGAAFGWASTNGVALDLVLSAEPAAPTWIPHPTNGMEYAVSTASGAIEALVEQADGYGATLATIVDQDLNDWLVDTFAPTGTRALFIGLTDSGEEGTFAWMSGEPYAFENWGDGQPNDAAGVGQDHGELLLIDEFLPEQTAFLTAGQWNDAMGVGWATNRAILERPADG